MNIVKDILRRRWASGASGALALALAATAVSAPPANAAEGDEGGGLTPVDRFDAGVIAYEGERFEAAQNAFGSIIDDGAFSPDVFFNLGNAEYRLSSPGRAVLNYRRALVLSPTHTEARQNLRFLQGQLDYRSLDESGAAVLARRIPLSWWAIATSVGWWLFVLGVAAPLCLRRGSHPVYVVTAITGFLVATVGCVALVAVLRLGIPIAERAVVIAPDAVANPSPVNISSSERGDSVFLPPGSEIQVLQERGAWLYAHVDEDTRGWVRKEFTEPLWPFDPDLVP